MRVIRVYTKDWEFLDEIYEYTNLEYTKGINTIDTMTFNMPLYSPQSTPTNLEFMNKIEYIDISINNEGKEVKKVLWEGVIVDRTFNSGDINIGCYSLLFLLSKRRLKSDKTFEKAKIGDIVRHIIEDSNSDIQNLKKLNYTLQLGHVDRISDTADRRFKTSNIALEELISLADEFGYYLGVDNRRLTFNSTLGRTKSDYILQFSKEGTNDNILKLPSLNQSITDTVNEAHGRVEFEKEYEEETEEEEKKTESNTASSKNECTVKKVDVWIRDRADWNSTKLIVAEKGAKLILHTKGKTWSKVEYKSKTGYIQNEYLTFSKTTSTTTSSSTTTSENSQTGTIKSTDVWIRKEANWNSEKLAVVKKGAKVLIVDKGSSWSKVTTEDKKTTGYIPNEYITFSASNISEGVILQLDEVYVGADDVYLLETSDDDATRLMRVQKGTVLKLHSKYSNWSKVETRYGVVGYIKNEFLTFAANVKEEKEMIIITSTRINESSQDMYGILEGVVDVDKDTREVSTIRTILDKELDTLSYAINTIDVDIIDSWLCPLSDINVGDRITLHLEPYFNFKNTVRILDISYSEKSNIFKLKLGNTVFKTEKPKYKLYSKNDSYTRSIVYANKSEVQAEDLKYDIDNENL